MAQLIEPRLVPLGGHRAMTVRRTLPAKDRAFIGAWCFVDHYGPERTVMDVASHPHTGLQTVSWLFEGEIEHRDALGTLGMVRPGEVNLMTAGAGICHTEVSTAATDILHGVQLWVALPEHARNVPRAFENHVTQPIAVNDRTTARVFLGSLEGIGSSPVTTHTPLLGAEIDLAAQAEATIRLDQSFEHGVLVDGGDVQVNDQTVSHGQLVHLEPGLTDLRLTTGDAPARALLLGGEPFEEEVIMWWNFLGRSHEEIEAWARAWNEQSADFGEVVGYEPRPGGISRIPAPEMPAGRLLPTVRRGRRNSVT